MYALVVRRRFVLLTVAAVFIALLLLFAWMYCEAFKKALAELNWSAPASESVTEVAAPAAPQVPLGFTTNAAAAQVNIKPGDDKEAGSDIPAAAVGSQAKVDSKQFFAQYRLERDRARSQQVDLLREMVNTPATDTESRAEAQKRLLELTQQMEREMELENLMVAKGYPEAAAFIQPEAVTVVLFSSPLKAEQKKEIASLASRLAGCTEEQVSIICRK